MRGCGIRQAWPILAAVSPHMLSMLPPWLRTLPPSAPAATPEELWMPQRCGSALTLHCALPTAPGTWGLHPTRGITVTDQHQPLSPFAAVLAPVPPTPPSGSEAPRGPHPGTGHRNRTIFSPGQAEALEKGARAGADGGPRRQRPRGLRAEAESWRPWMPLRRGVG